MDDTKSYSVDSDLLMNEDTDNEASEEKEEKPPPHVTLHEKEIIEKDENDQLLCRVAEPEVLDSVHRYAKRIKSFLGWEPLLDEHEKDEDAHSNNAERFVSSGSEVKDECNSVDEKKKNGEMSLECKYDENRDDDFEEERVGIKNSDLITASLDHENELLVPGELTSDLGEHYSDRTNASLQNSCNMGDLNNISPECDKSLTESEEANLDTKDITQSENVAHEKTLDNTENDLKNESDLVDKDSEFKMVESNEEASKPEETVQGTNSENASSPNDLQTEDINTISSENFKSDKIVNPVEERQSLEFQTSVLPGSDQKDVTSESKNEQMEKNDSHALDETSTSDDTPGSRDINELVASDGKIWGKSAQSEPIVSPTNTEKQSETDLKESFEVEDCKKKDSLPLDECIPLKNDIDKPLMNEIRRLSMIIVKDVIESARSSIHEIFTNKSEESKEGNVSEILDNLANNNVESQLRNGNKQLENNSSEKINDIAFKESKLDSKNVLEFSSKGSSDPFQNENMYDDKEIIEGNDNVFEDTIVCGFGSFKPQWIQQYSRSKVFLVLFSIIGVIHGCYYPYFVSIISTLEKRYAFRTKVSGTLLLADEITPLILGVIVGYIGSRTHRPRMVAIGMFLSAACCFITGLPFLIYGPAKHLSVIKYANETGPEICDVEKLRSGECDNDDAPPTLTVVGIFLLASFLKGFATLSYYVIGISYIDDNIKKKNSPLYLAVALALRLLGPMVGFLMSSAFLKFYENPAHDPGYGPDDPRWVGAWWIGFFLQGVLLVIFTLPIALFPRRLPGQKIVERKTASGSEDGLKQVFVGFYSALKRLATNPVFVLMIVNTTMKIFGHFGHAIMLPKYVENQFRLSASEASLYSGATSITFMMLSTIFGGYFIWKFRPKIKVLLGGMIVSELVLCIGFLILIIPRCQIVDMVHFGMNDDGLILNSACNQMCDCSTSSYTPFCGPEGTTYFSPCFAGCTQEMISMSVEKQKEFRNCSCVAIPAEQNLVSIVSEGVCPDEKCWSQALTYLIIYFILLTISNAFTVAHSMILLRSVHPSDKSVALGTFETFISLFGFIPFPITFGALVDSACLVWEESCGQTGNCWFYDMEKYSYLLHGASSLFCFFSVFCLIGLYFLSPRVRDLYEDDEEEKDYVDIKLDTVSGSITKL